MDGLALLCALHADGPQSLRRLRRSGCPSLESIAGLDIDRLAELLASTPTAAQRFQREAHILLLRIGSGEQTTGGAAGASARRAAALLEVEDGASSEMHASPATPPAHGDVPLAPRQAYGDVPLAPRQAYGDVPLAPRQAYGDVPLAPSQVYGDVLLRWRELDALEDARAVAEPIVEESSAPSPHPSPRTQLSALQDLADESRDALIAVGIVDLEGLAACDALELSCATGLDYSNAMRWRSLARRALPSGVDRFSHSGLPDSQRAPLLALDDYILHPNARPEPARGASSAPETYPVRADVREETAGGPFA